LRLGNEARTCIRLITVLIHAKSGKDGIGNFLSKWEVPKSRIELEKHLAQTC
jgi:hypothetical protein